MTEDSLKISWKRRLWVIPPILIGVAAIVVSPMIKNKPKQIQVVERTTKVRAMTVPELAVVSRTTGYGTVKPSRTWEAVAEVAGQVVWVSEALKNGHSVKAGTEVLRIEDINYRLALAQIQAQLNTADVKDKTTHASLAIASKDLKVLIDDYNRKKGLAAKGVITKSTVESAERQMFNGESQVQNLKNILALSSVERQVLIAQKASAELDLKRTHIKAPFDVRITNVNIGEAQYANKGQLMFAADGLGIAEVEAQFPIGVLRPLIAGSIAKKSSLEIGALALNAKVRLKTTTHTVAWSARVDRVSGVIDPQTQSLGVVVAIDNPLSQAKPGKRPPLYRNTFVEVELTSEPIKKQVVVPLSTLRNGKVYIVDQDNRLDIRKVSIAFSQGGYAVIKKGIKPGERIVTSDLVSAISGMLLAPQEDEKTKRILVTETTGRESQK